MDRRDAPRAVRAALGSTSVRDGVGIEGSRRFALHSWAQWPTLRRGVVQASQHLVDAHDQPLDPTETYRDHPSGMPLSGQGSHSPAG